MPRPNSPQRKRPIASVHIHLARFGWAYSKFVSGLSVESTEKKNAAKADWLDRFVEALVTENPSIHDYAATLLAEVEEYRKGDSDRKKAIIPDSMERMDSKDSRHSADSHLRQTVSKKDSKTDQKEKEKDQDPPLPPSGDLKALESESVKNFTARVISYLNRKTGKNYKVVKGTERLIGARLKDGFHPDDFKAVIDRKCADWLNDEKMEQYLRPVTLFGASKMEGYLNQLGPGVAATTPAPRHNGNAYVPLDIYIGEDSKNG